MSTAEYTIFDPKIIKEAIAEEIAIKEARGDDNLNYLLKDIRDEVIDTVLVSTYGNKSKSARMIGVNRGTFNSWFKKAQARK